MMKTLLAAVFVATLSMGSPGYSQVAPNVAPPPPVLNMCTGMNTGKYFAVGHLLKKRLTSTNVNVISTEGSLENLEGIEAGRCDAALVQDDALRVYSQTRPQLISSVERAAALYKEYVQFVCNRQANVTSVSNLPRGIRVAIGSERSGSAITWMSIASSDKNKFAALTDSRMGVRALSAVADGSEVQCMIFVSGLSPPLLTSEINGRVADKVVIVPIDSDMEGIRDSKGRPVYSYETIPSATYGKIMPSGMLWGKRDVKTIAVSAVLIISSKWIDQNPDRYNRILSTLNTMSSDVLELVTK